MATPNAPTFVLIPGAGGAAWYWHLVQTELEVRGFQGIAVDLPADDDAAGLAEYVAQARAAIGDRRNLILVGQSLGGFTAAALTSQVPVVALVFLNAMIPLPGETAGAWWENTGHSAALRRSDIGHGRKPDAGFDQDFYFLHDVPPDVAAAGEPHLREQSDTVFGSICDFQWPAVPITVLVGGQDRFFPPEFQQRIAVERLGNQAEIIPGGHLAALSHPTELVDSLVRVADFLETGTHRT